MFAVVMLNVTTFLVMQSYLFSTSFLSHRSKCCPHHRFPRHFLDTITHPVSTLFVIIFYKYLLFLSYITTYLTTFSYVTNVRQLISYEIASLFQWRLSKKKTNGNRSGTSNAPVIVRHCLELQRLLQATNHLSCARQNNRHNQELPCCLQTIIFSIHIYKESVYKLY